MLTKKLLIVLSVIVMAVAFVFIQGCDTNDNPVEPKKNSSEIEVVELISEDMAREIAIKSGINEASIIYVDVVPYDNSGSGEFDIVWAVVTELKSGFKGHFIDAFTGEILTQNVKLPDNVQDRINELFVDGINKVASAVNHYESYPWGYDLPTNFGNHALTQGYGTGTHVNGCCSYNQNHYAVDFSMRLNECVPAPGSGWCMFAGDRGDGYGKQVIILAGSAGGSNRYVYRLAHLNYISVVPGWWISKNRSVGGAGTTGNSTGVHLHFSIHRGYYSHGNIYGGSVPLDRWPGTGDRVDYFNRYAYWQFSFNVCR